MMRVLACLPVLAVWALVACSGDPQRSGTEDSGQEQSVPGADSAVQVNGPLPDSLASDTGDQFRAFMWFFLHIRPNTVFVSPGTVQWDGQPPKQPYRFFQRIPGKYVQRYLQRPDTSRAFYYIMRLMPDASLAGRDSLTRVLIADSTHFHVVYFHSNGQQVAWRTLTSTEGSTVQQVYLFPNQRQYLTLRTENAGSPSASRTVVTGMFDEKGQFTEKPLADNSFIGLTNLFPQKNLPYKVECDPAQLINPYTNTTDLHPGYLVAQLDTSWRPLLGFPRAVPAVYPLARLYLEGGNFGLVVCQATSRGTTPVNDYVLYICKPRGGVISRTVLATCDGTTSDSFEIMQGGKKILLHGEAEGRVLNIGPDGRVQ